MLDGGSILRVLAWDLNRNLFETSNQQMKNCRCSRDIMTLAVGCPGVHLTICILFGIWTPIRCLCVCFLETGGCRITMLVLYTNILLDRKDRNPRSRCVMGFGIWGCLCLYPLVLPWGIRDGEEGPLEPTWGCMPNLVFCCEIVDNEDGWWRILSLERHMMCVLSSRWLTRGFYFRLCWQQGFLLFVVCRRLLYRGGGKLSLTLC